MHAFFLISNARKIYKMNEYLKKFDTIRFVATWSIFRNFLEIFHFLELKIEFWIWTGLKPAQTGTGLDRFDR